MKKTLFVAPILVLTLIFGGLLTGCAGGGGGAGSGGEHMELTIFTPWPEVEFPYYFRRFEEETGITLNFVRISTGEAMARLQVEGDNATATLMWGGPNDTHVAMQRAGLLYPYQSPELENVPELFHDPEGYWNPIAVGSLVFASNSEWFGEQNIPYPQSWQDLLRPELRGQITMAHPSTSGTAYNMLATIIKIFDYDEEAAFDYMRRFDENIRHYTRVGAAPAREAAIGEAAVGLVFSQDALSLQAEGFPINVSFPSEGTGYTIEAASIIRGGFPEEFDNARKFIDWSMSVRAQELFINTGSMRMPVNTNAAVTEGLIPLDQIELVVYDAVWAGENRTRLVEEFMSRIDDAEDLAE